MELTLRLERVLRRVRLGHVDDTVHIERHLLAGGAPALVAEAVDIFAVGLGFERVVAVGHSLLVHLILARRGGDLELQAVSKCIDCSSEILLPIRRK